MIDRPGVEKLIDSSRFILDMRRKSIRVTEDAYNLLKEKKFTGESFSEEIGRLFGAKKKGR